MVRALCSWAVHVRRDEPFPGWLRQGIQCPEVWTCQAGAFAVISFIEHLRAVKMCQSWIFRLREATGRGQTRWLCGIGTVARRARLRHWSRLKDSLVSLDLQESRLHICQFTRILIAGQLCPAWTLRLRGATGTAHQAQHGLCGDWTVGSGGRALHDGLRHRGSLVHGLDLARPFVILATLAYNPW